MLFTCAFSFALLVILASIIYAKLVHPIITKHRKRETEKLRSWVGFAKAHGLKMMSDNGLGKGAYIEGDFPGCHLKLETVQRNTFAEFNKTYTHLILTINEDIGRKEEILTSLETINPEFITTTSSSELNTDFQRNIRALGTIFALAPGRKLKGRVDVDKDDRVIRYEQTDVETDVDYLSHLFGLMSDTAEAYLEIVELGSEVVPLLQPMAMDRNHELQGVVRHLLQDIGKDTTNRLAHQTEKLLCLRCLTKCAVHQLKLSSFETITYYGCRTCHQSRDFIEWEGKIVVRLDRNMIAKQVQQNGDLQINWLMRGDLFDFDTVEIAEVTAEDIERFVVKVGNDTDSVRKSKYKEIPCKITTQRLLSENAIKLLKHTFDGVEQK